MKTKRTKKASLIAMIICCSVLLTCSTGPITGQTIKEKRDCDTFNKLALAMSANIYLSQGDRQSVEIEADKATLENIETETRGNTLTVKSKEGHWRNLGPVKIYITMKDISQIDVSGSGSIVAETSIRSTDMKMNVSGSGNIKVPALETNVASIKITGSGDINLAGKNDEARLDVTITGSGSFKADELPVGNASITITGSGSARINVLKALETNITGSGSVLYKGNPVVDARSTGSGRTSGL
jgi:hypothetical protein